MREQRGGQPIRAKDEAKGTPLGALNASWGHLGASWGSLGALLVALGGGPPIVPHPSPPQEEKDEEQYKCRS